MLIAFFFHTHTHTNTPRKVEVDEGMRNTRTHTPHKHTHTHTPRKVAVDEGMRKAVWSPGTVFFFPDESVPWYHSDINSLFFFNSDKSVPWYLIRDISNVCLVDEGGRDKGAPHHRRHVCMFSIATVCVVCVCARALVCVRVCVRVCAWVCTRVRTQIQSILRCK